MLDWGIRSGGGIGDILPKISYRFNPGVFMARFVYVMIFYILVILVLGNIFLGIIVDTFADLRDKNEAKEVDMKNKCFICQISRDDSLNKNIDYEEHIKEDHFIWNYIYFLTYLHISNPNDFNSLENYVWDKLSEKDISWIPIIDNDSN